MTAILALGIFVVALIYGMWISKVILAICIVGAIVLLIALWLGEFKFNVEV
jgi:hypothetical protein